MRSATIKMHYRLNKYLIQSKTLKLALEQNLTLEGKMAVCVLFLPELLQNNIDNVTLLVQNFLKIERFSLKLHQNLNKLSILFAWHSPRSIKCPRYIHMYIFQSRNINLYPALLIRTVLSPINKNTQLNQAKKKKGGQIAN